MPRFQRLGPSAAAWILGGAALSCAHAGAAAPAEQPVVEPPSSTPACLGAASPITLARGLPYAKVAVGEPRAELDFLVDYATNVSTIDPTRAAIAGCGLRAREGCELASLGLFGAWRRVSLRPARHRDRAPGVEQAGILGTDVTSALGIALDYGHGQLRSAPRSKFCSARALVGAGLVPLSAAGFFADDASRLRPLSDVVAGASPRRSVANVPTVPLRIAGVIAHTQLDTGFEDAVVPYAINVNEALLEEVRAKDPTALTRTPDKDLSLSTCAGVPEPVEAYALRPGLAVDLVAETGQAARSFAGATLFVKRTPPAARACGGIGTWTAPAAQIGSSFFAALGLVVFDPFASRVWV